MLTPTFARVYTCTVKMTVVGSEYNVNVCDNRKEINWLPLSEATCIYKLPKDNMSFTRVLSMKFLSILIKIYTRVH